jgi:thiol-disulfide isomerase/thioredoxin
LGLLTTHLPNQSEYSANFAVQEAFSPPFCLLFAICTKNNDMNRIVTFLLITVFAAQLTAQQIQFTGRILGCPECTKVHLYELNGLAAKSLVEGVLVAGTTDNYQFSLPAGEPKIYGLGLDQENVKHIVLGKESGFTVWGNCEKMPYARTVGSETNGKLESILKEIRNSDEALIKYRGEYNNLKSIGMDASVWLTRIAETDSIKKKALTDAQALGSFYAPIAGLATQYSFEKNAQAGESEAAYLSRVFFQHVNLKDKAFNQIPQLFNAFKTYAEEASKIAPAPAQLDATIKAVLSQIPDSSPAYRAALGGAIAGLKTLNSPLYFDYASKYIERYKAQDRGEINRLDFDLNKNRTFIPGMVAPDLSGPTPEGATYSLNAMRGKVVLLDFWASWCGPCRRENPNVKAAYDKYKGKGFDILGVSLDKTKEAWVGAIQADGLPWHHISDLKGWQSDHAALYSVTSIPQTLLIDREGKIIERNLRGPALEAKLKEIFGE